MKRFGGIDIAVLNAGIFPPSQRLDAFDLEAWRRVMNINLDASVALLHHLHPLLRLAPRGGRVVVIGSKNVAAPGPGAAAYSASKAALTQVARVAALEWGADGIRVNVIHPNAVFDTALWTDEIVEARAASVRPECRGIPSQQRAASGGQESRRCADVRGDVRTGLRCDDRCAGPGRRRQRAGYLDEHAQRHTTDRDEPGAGRRA